MTLWFRCYSELVDDPKVQRLPDPLFRALINLWCLAAQNGGLLPDIGDISFKLRMSEAKAEAAIAGLRAAGLIDATAKGLVPHNWDGRQFKSDVSNERVKRFRERQRNGGGNVTGNGNATPPEADSRIQTIDNINLNNPARDFKPFPPDGSIAYSSPYVEIARKHAKGADPDIFASAFRKYCHGEGIPFDDPLIERKFNTFCGKHKVQGLHS